jgi:hypothetical protein
MLSVMFKVRMSLTIQAVYPTGTIGNVNLAALTFDDYTVDKQAYSISSTAAPFPGA